MDGSARRQRLVKLTLTDCLLVMAGSACGGLARYLLASLVPTRAPGGEFPWGILIANVTGCFCLAFLYGYLSSRPDAWSGWRPLLGVGFLGGYTTFSTLMSDTARLGPKVGGVNLFVSLAAGYVAILLGDRFAR